MWRTAPTRTNSKEQQEGGPAPTYPSNTSGSQPSSCTLLRSPNRTGHVKGLGLLKGDRRDGEGKKQARENRRKAQLVWHQSTRADHQTNYAVASSTWKVLTRAAGILC